LQQGYEKLLSTVGRVVGQAKRFSDEIAEGVKRSADVMEQAALKGLRQELDTIVPRVQQVIRQAKQRIFGGDTHVAEKLVSIFEPTTEIIRKGKASKPTEFGKMVKIQEGENQIITDYAVYEKRPSDSELVIAALDAHEKKLGCIPRLVAGDAAFYSPKNEAAAHDRGVKRVCIPSRSTKSADRKREQKKRWFKQGQKVETGCEGRISVLKRRHGLRRCLYRGDAGMKRWVGLGVIADNLTHIGTVLAETQKLNSQSLPQSNAYVARRSSRRAFRRSWESLAGNSFLQNPLLRRKVVMLAHFHGLRRGLASFALTG